MILIITHKQDFTADYVIDILNKRGIDYFRLNCEDFPQEDIHLRFGSRTTLSLFGDKPIRSVWYRRTKLPVINAESPSEQLYMLKEADSFLSNLIGIIPGKWLSNPVAVREAENKFLQLRVAQELELSVPETLISTSKEEIKAFYQTHKKLIIKPLNTGRIDYPEGNSKLLFSNIVNREKMEMLDSMEFLPSIFQQYIEKEYELRITIVGAEVFVAKVLSQSDPETAVDWRRKNLKFSTSELPEDVSSKCKEMIKRLGIEFGAFDFIKTPKGEYYFLEVNPNGQWVWIEIDTGLKISEAIINYLKC